MFISYYKTINNEGDISCVLSRGSLTTNNKDISIKNTILNFDQDNYYSSEANRFFTMIENQNLYIASAGIAPEIRATCASLLVDLRNAKLSNLDKKCSLLISIEIYKPGHMFYMDWLDQWISIEEGSPELIGKPYVKYKLKTGKEIRIIEDLLETMG